MAKVKRRAQGVQVKGAAASASDGATGAAPSAEKTSERKKKRLRRGTSRHDQVGGAEPASEAALTGPASEGVESREGQAPAPEGPWQCPRSSAAQALQWLLWPLSPEVFFSEYWEKKPLHLQRRQSRYYEGLFSKAVLDAYLSQGGQLAYGERLNLVRFDAEAGRKVDLNSHPRGTPAKQKDVASAWEQGASIQVMHPQQFHKAAWALMSALESSFGSLFGANSYLTPGGQQGLAPHYDDVEVFMLQLEGSKRWRLHKPPDGEEYPLPRESSRDFEPGELGEQLFECVLEPGDLLYFPRGTVHQGVSEPGGYSHHLTVSTYQFTAWSQVLERALSGAVARAAGECLDLRQGLPLNFFSYMGSWHDIGSGEGAQSAEGSSSSKAASRASFVRRFRGLLKRLEDFLDVDEVCDELAVDFMSQRLPPYRDPISGTHGGPPASSTEEKASAEPSAMTLEHCIRWVDPAAVRAMISSDPDTGEITVMVFHCFSNERDQHMNREIEPEEDVGCIRFEAATFLPAVRALWATGETFLRCRDLPITREDNRISFCEALREGGLIEVVPLE
eukprot:CAMPEP_0170574592 /NCGR_PEP_ID=MMETSP0224-20130122/3385_1 /TAXON_ID=285029 /ORGANISM="Togula jolla, Strain CCCM 725" /LENGTH=561 /DNA_ID=CAMNT_0010897265 /DNA_START=19 /DNA_END=1701 /DNA_ORIENTATION=+